MILTKQSSRQQTVCKQFKKRKILNLKIHTKSIVDQYPVASDRFEFWLVLLLDWIPIKAIEPKYNPKVNTIDQTKTRPRFNDSYFRVDNHYAILGYAGRYWLSPSFVLHSNCFIIFYYSSSLLVLSSVHTNTLKAYGHITYGHRS